MAEYVPRDRLAHVLARLQEAMSEETDRVVTLRRSDDGCLSMEGRLEKRTVSETYIVGKIGGVDIGSFQPVVMHLNDLGLVHCLPTGGKVRVDMCDGTVHFSSGRHCVSVPAADVRDDPWQTRLPVRDTSDRALPSQFWSNIPSFMTPPGYASRRFPMNANRFSEFGIEGFANGGDNDLAVARWHAAWVRGAGTANYHGHHKDFQRWMYNFDMSFAIACAACFSDTPSVLSVENSLGRANPMAWTTDETMIVRTKSGGRRSLDNAKELFQQAKIQANNSCRVAVHSDDLKRVVSAMKDMGTFCGLEVVHTPESGSRLSVHWMGDSVHCHPWPWDMDPRASVATLGQGEPESSSVVRVNTHDLLAAIRASDAVVLNIAIPRQKNSPVVIQSVFTDFVIAGELI